jgi:adenosylcobinamide kinase/adenosylcobinamide-phosphate guanylyltransferase
MITLITGGIRSGKSRYALELASQQAGPKCFIATAEALDEDMKLRIARHQQERGAEWTTREVPLYLNEALRQAPPSQYLVIDCLTLWVSNLLHYQLDPEAETRKLEEALKAAEMPVVLVTNEVGLGIIPDNPLARRYADALGRVNQKIAKLAGRVILMVSGIPTEIKEGRYEKLAR